MAGRGAPPARSGIGSAGLIDLFAFGRPLAPTDGGSARFLAEADYIETRLGGRVVDLAETLPGRSFAIRSVAIIARLVRELARTKAQYVLLEYPGFPSVGVYYASDRPSLAARLVADLAYVRAHLMLALIRALCRARGKTLIVGIGDVPSQQMHFWRPASRRLTARWERAVLRAADVIWAVTAEERDLLVRLYGLSPDRFVLVPNGSPSFEPAQRGPNDGKVRVVYTGTLSRVDDTLPEAIEAALEVPDRDVRVTLAGSGGEWVRERFGDERVEWVGTLSERECYDLVGRSDVALIVYFPEEPYYDLAHPSKLSLYIAAATPIVAGDAAHIATFVREHEVGLVASRSGYADALQRLIGDESLRRQLAENAAAIREEYTWEAIFERAIADTERVAAR